MAHRLSLALLVLALHTGLAPGVAHGEGSIVTLGSDARPEAGSIEGVHPLPDGPWIFARAELGKPPAQQLTQRARQNLKYPAGSHPDQQNLFTSKA